MSDNQPLPSKSVLVKNLQRESLMQCLHDIQSPLSGASGYLELMQICINGDKDLFKIARYRNKIQEGLHELEDILLQMTYLYKGDSDGDDPALIEFDLNWLVKDLASNVGALAKKREQTIIFESEGQNIHVQTDMIVLKLLLYNLIIAALKAAGKGERIEMGLNRSREFVIVQIRIHEIIRPVGEVLSPFVADEDESAALPDSGTGLRFGARAIDFLNGSIQIGGFGDHGAEISLFLPA